MCVYIIYYMITTSAHDDNYLSHYYTCLAIIHFIYYYKLLNSYEHGKAALRFLIEFPDCLVRD